MVSITATMENDVKKDMKNNTNTKMKIICLLFLIGAIVAGTVFVIQMRTRMQAEKELEELAQSTVPTQTSEATETSEVTEESDTASVEPTEATEEHYRELPEGIPVPEKEIDFAKLKEETNADIYAWIYIPDTKIDYPVLQHPTDNYYYLDYNLDGSKGYPGCIYTEDYNSKDFTDSNTVLYGHNMKNGTMFAGLHKYADSQYFEEHPYVYIYTEDELLVYQIFAAYEYTNAHLLKKFDPTTEYGFGQYLKEIDEVRSMNSVRDENIQPDVDDNLLTLSTCIANKPDNRFLVQGVLLNED